MIFLDEADAQLAREDWLEITADLSEEELAELSRPEPAPDYDAWEAMFAAMRGEGDEMLHLPEQDQEYYQRFGKWAA